MNENNVEPGKKENLPPPGTYPSPNTKPPEQPKAPHERTRRVGTVTMALFLIFMGVIMLVSVFVPTLNLIFIARLSPVIFILLGLEILLYSFFDKKHQIKYDFASIILCLFLIGGTLMAGIFPLLIQRSWQEDEVYRVKHSQLNQISDQILAENDLLLDVSWNIGVYNTNMFWENSLFFDRSAELTERLVETVSHVGANVTLTKNYETKEAFLLDAQKAIVALKPFVPELEWVQINSKDFDEMPQGMSHFTLQLDRPYSVSPQKYGYYLNAWYYDPEQQNFYNEEDTVPQAIEEGQYSSSVPSENTQEDTIVSSVHSSISESISSVG